MTINSYRYITIDNVLFCCYWEQNKRIVNRLHEKKYKNVSFETNLSDNIPTTLLRLQTLAKSY